jgi:sterol desaturase/sphingolipid hydroxylase (fatty acid hydroxylase superfamily)
MQDLLIDRTAAISNAALYIPIIVAALWEIAAPRRDLQQATHVRWLNNLGLALLSGVFARALVPLTGIAAAVLARDHGFGLLNAVAAPSWLAVVIAILALDLFNYLLHVVTHAVPLLWCVHTVHHADLDFDFTTGLRHHPLELLVDAAALLSAVAALGAPPAAVVLYQAIDIAAGIFSHANVRFPARAESALRRLIVTPDMHRVHHSAIKRETNSNYGSLLSLWDRIFGTYRASPAVAHRDMTIGLEYFRAPRYLYLHQILLLPALAAKRR